MVHRAGVSTISPAPGDVVPGLRGRGAAPGLRDAEAVGAARVGAALECEGELALAARVRAGDGETSCGGGALKQTTKGRDVSL